MWSFAQIDHRLPHGCKPLGKTLCAVAPRPAVGDSETAEQVARLRIDAMTSLPRRWDYALTLNSSPASTVPSAPERQQDQSTQSFEDRRFCSSSQAKVERRSITQSCSMTSRAAAASSGLATLSAKIGYVACSVLHHSSARAPAHSNKANTVSYASFCQIGTDG